MNNAAAATIAAKSAAAGATFTPEGVEITEGFSVAGITKAARYAAEDFTAETLLAAMSLFAGTETFGSWLEEGEVWIEPTTIVLDATEAHDLAVARDEIAYYDLTNGKEIRLR